MNAGGQSFARDDAREPRRAWHAVVALFVMGSVACGESSTTRPPLSGSLVLTTETSGFFKDDSYELLVDGVSQGTIGANDEMTISELDPATYQVDLGDVAANCVVEGASASVAPDETATVALTIACEYSEPTAYTLRYDRDRPNLEDGEITECSFGFCPTQEGWDMYVFYNSQTTPQSVIRQNETAAVEIAHLAGVAFADLTEADYAGASFGTDLVADPFDAGRVILIRTDTGQVYALGNPVEDGQALTLTFDAALIVQP
jgi:hypothetical protein